MTREERLTAARDAVVEAAEQYVNAKVGDNVARYLTGIWEAVANLRAVKKEAGGE